MADLMMYENLQMEPIEIQPYSIVEIYAGNLDDTSCLGYYIQPVVDEMATEIEIKVKQIADKSSEYDSFIILAGNNSQDYRYRKVYAVWYNATDGTPTFPPEKEVPEIGNPAKQPEVYSTFTIDNEGVDSPATIELTIGNSTDRVVELWLNDNYMTITLPEILTESNNVVIVSANGVLLNQQIIDTFNIQSIPKIKNGSNSLKIKNINVTKAKVTYKEKH